MSSQQKKNFLTFSLVWYMVLIGLAQPSTNWYFGNKAAIKFTPTGPVAITGSQMNTMEGCSSMSDENGNSYFIQMDKQFGIRIML